MSEDRGVTARRATYFSFASRYTGFVLQFVAVVALSRLLTPVEIGIYSLSLAFVGLFQAFRDFGISTYIIQHKNLDRDVLRSAYGLALAMATAIALALLACARPAASFYDQPGVAEVMGLLAVALWLSPLMFPVRSMLSRELAFDRLFALNTVSGGVNMAASIAFAWSGFSYLSGAMAMILATACEIAFAALFLRRLIFIRPRFRGWRPILGFGGYTSMTTLITNFAVDAPDFVLGKTLGFGAVAFFSRANGLLNIFRQTVHAAVLPVALAAFSAEARGRGRMRQHYIRATDLYLGVAWPFYAMASLLAPELILVVFGDQWTAASPVARVLCLGAMLWAPMVLSGQVMLSLGLVRAVFVREAIVQGVRVGIVAATSFHSVLAVAWGMVAVYALASTVAQHQLRGATDIGLGDIVKGLRRSAAVTAATLILPLCLAVQPFVELSPIAMLAAAGGVAGAAWLAALHATGHPLWAEIEILAAAVAGRLGLGRGLAAVAAPRRKEG